MKIEKILFPTQFREPAFKTLETLLVLKNAGLKEIVLCFIVPIEEVAFVPFGGYLKEEEERLREEAKIRFEDWRKSLARTGIGTRIVIEVGDPVAKILSIAEREKADLIIAGKKGRTGDEGILLESRTVEILRRSRIPVLAHKYMVQFAWEGEMATRTNERIFERPLLATDWSPSAGRALELLASLKNVVKKAIVTHVIPSRISRGAGMSEMLQLERERREALGRQCAMLESAGVEVESHLSAGDEAEEILDISREFGASMIVMGTSGKDRLHEFFLGSVSHRVAERSELPILIVP
ncbi:MAG TPA: universal stress protein [Dissulfurispiraceae bacterium]